MSLKDNILSFKISVLKVFIGFCIYGFLLVNLVSCKERDEHEGHYVDLTKKENLDSLLGDLDEATNNVVISSQPSVKVVTGIPNATLKVSGTIQLDERRTNVIAARAPGRIEKLYVRYNYQLVSQGQPVLSLYSPELITAMEQYLMLYRAGNEKEMLQKTAQKLRLLGITESQLRQMEQQDKPLQNIVFYSPYSGFILFGDASVNSANPSSEMPSADGMNDMGVNEENNTPAINTNSAQQPGSYVQEGQTLFSVNDIKQVWAVFSIPNKFVSSIKTGTPIKIQVEGFTQPITAKIDFIEPVYNKESKFSSVRVYLPNPQNKIKLNALATAEIDLQSTEGLIVPSNSVYSLGRQQIVWLKTGERGGNNIFKAQTVTTGTISNGKIQIITGLKSGDEIAENAAYLVDSEGLIHVNP